MDELTKGILTGGGIAIGTVIALGLVGYALYKNMQKQQTTTSTTSTTRTTTPPTTTTTRTTTPPTTTTTQGYTVTIINSCYPVITTYQLPVLVVYTDIDKQQKSIIISYGEQATIQVYPNSVVSIYMPETTPLPVSSGSGGIIPMLIGGRELKWKLIQQITVNQNMTLQVCNKTVTKAGNGGIIQPL